MSVGRRRGLRLSPTISHHPPPSLPADSDSFAGDGTPSNVFPSLLGRPRMPLPILTKSLYVGAEARAKRGILRLCGPVEDGRVLAWNDMEEVRFL